MSNVRMTQKSETTCICASTSTVFCADPCCAGTSNKPLTGYKELEYEKM